MSGQPPKLTTEQLSALYNNNEEHARWVAHLAVQIFQKTRDIHELPDEAIPLLQTGAFLHNLGLYFGVRDHHIRSKEIIVEHGLAGFTERETVIIALIALFHRKRVRATREPLFASLDPEDQSLTLRLSAVVRVADGLDFFQDQTARLTYYDDTRRVLRFYLSNASAGAWVNAQRATEKADLWADVMPRPVRFVVEGGQRYYLRRGDTMQTAAYKVFSHFFHDILKYEKKARLREDPEDLHQLRVATRRLRSSLRPFRKVFGRETVESFSEDLRRVTRATGEVRDLDVFVEALASFPSAHRAPSFLSHLKERHDAAVEAMLTALDDPAYSRFKERFVAFVANIHPWNHPSERKAARAKARIEAATVLGKRLAAVLAFQDRLSGDDEAQLHQLRIACKRFRYVADFLSETLDVKRGVFLRPFKNLQDSLGEIHDAFVRANYIRGYLEEHRAELSAEEQSALEDLLTENQQRRDDFLEVFQRQWREFLEEPYQKRLRQLIDPEGRFFAAQSGRAHATRSD